MKIKVLKDEKQELIIEFETKDFTIPDAIADELLDDSSVEYAGATKEYRTVSNPTLKIVGKKPKESLVNAMERIVENVADLKIPHRGKK